VTTGSRGLASISDSLLSKRRARRPAEPADGDRPAPEARAGEKGEGEWCYDEAEHRAVLEASQGFAASPGEAGGLARDLVEAFHKLQVRGEGGGGANPSERKEARGWGGQVARCPAPALNPTKPSCCARFARRRGGRRRGSTRASATGT
jgi:hypothetical protein